jgi:hypothetical protein
MAAPDLGESYSFDQHLASAVDADIFPDRTTIDPVRYRTHNG